MLTEIRDLKSFFHNSFDLFFSCKMAIKAPSITTLLITALFRRQQELGCRDGNDDNNDDDDDDDTFLDTEEESTGFAGGIRQKWERGVRDENPRIFCV